ncbi:GspE/PulE family protein, partial [bacterium]|nr:GspE/PulE family protein [bacterium]
MVNKNRESEDLKLGEILRDAGLISTENLERFLVKHRESGESLSNILKREVSLDSLKSLMRFEIPLPFMKKGGQENVKNVLMESGIITDEELSMALQSDGDLDNDLGKKLIRNSIISARQLDRAVKEQEKTGLPLWRTLLDLGMVNSSIISGLMKPRIGTHISAAKEDLMLDVLLNTALLKQEQVDKARRITEEIGGSVLTHLVETGVLPIDQVGKTFEKILDIKFINPQDIDPDPNMMFVLPEHILRQEMVFPVEVTDGVLLLGMVDPLDESAIHKIQMITGLKIQPCLMRESQMEAVIESLVNQKPDSGTGSELEKILKGGTLTGAISSGDMSAVQLASSIIDGAINAGATDIHFESQAPEMRVRYRIDGVLYDVMNIPRHHELPVISRLKLLSKMDISEKRKPQDGHFTMRLKGREFNFRTATIPVYQGEKMTIRLLDESKVLKGLKQLGFEQDDLIRYKSLLERPNGLIIVTGPIGSGKTTTLYASLNQTNILSSNVITIEDPVEYRLSGINQVQINPDIGLDFRTGLRSILRHDADIIMVGEVRDGESARVATWAALTGQLVFCTLHTNSAAGAI